MAAKSKWLLIARAPTLQHGAWRPLVSTCTQEPAPCFGRSFPTALTWQEVPRSDPSGFQAKLCTQFR